MDRTERMTAFAVAAPVTEREPVAAHDGGWDFDQVNADADELRTVRAEHGPGAMLAHAIGLPLSEWRETDGIDRPAGR